MKLRTWTYLLLALTVLRTCVAVAQHAPVTVGIEVLISDSLHLLKGKRVGLICNHTSVFPNGVHAADSLAAMKNVSLAAIFTPEHGLRGVASAGEHVTGGMWNGIQVHSLYGNSRRPSKAMLAGIDVLVFDMQDVGARFYTYISTMGYCMEEAARCGISMIVCDRPNPIRGDIVQGPVLDVANKSFVGLYPMPVRHGMTVAEIARMAVANKWLDVTGVDLHPIPMQGWKRSMWYDETGLPWIAPSPNIPDLETALLYTGMCFVEGTNLSEGRGTSTPFKITGAPFIDADALAARLSHLSIPGAQFEPVEFTPRSKQGAASPKYENKVCRGVRVSVVERDAINPIFIGTAILAAAGQYPEAAYTKYLPLLMGVRISRNVLTDEEAVRAMLARWSAQAYNFVQLRNNFLLYD